ncbi:MAG TPA: hypothetical protein VFI97_09800 [Arthrobacter sp.]|nr:hypothetical protein [Arthrobacter sp.]
MEQHPWSSKKMRRLGQCIRDNQEIPEGVPTYADVMLYFNDLAIATQNQLMDLDWVSLLGDRTFEITSRPKTIDTLSQKLKRNRTTPLGNVQDIAGVRFEAEMSLDEQDAVVTAIAGLFDHDLESSIHDLRDSPHSGYRAVHLWLRFPARVEVQVRTHLQGMWANMYESAADAMGRGIRYGEIPADKEERAVVTALHDLSADIQIIEHERNQLEQLTLEVDSILREESTADVEHPHRIEGLRLKVEELRGKLAVREDNMAKLCDTLRAQFVQEREARRGA